MPDVYIPVQAETSIVRFTQPSGSHCNRGEGKTNAAFGPRDCWIDAATFEEAWEHAGAPGRKQGACGVCNPSPN